MASKKAAPYRGGELEEDDDEEVEAGGEARVGSGSGWSDG
jgi:hypothetical protein